MVTSATLNRTSIASRLHEGYLDATTLMEHCIKQGIPQRTAHHLVGSLVRSAMEAKCTLSDLPDEVYQQQDERLGPDVKQVLGVEQAVRAFQSYGSTNPKEVQTQIRRWKDRIGVDEPAA